MRIRAHVMILIALLAAAFPAAAQSDRKYIVLEPAPEGQTPPPFSDAVLVGDTLYLSGYVGVDPKTLRPPASPEDETRLAMDDLKRRVEAAGMTMDDLVMVNILSTDLSLFKNFNSVYRTYFHNGFPARTFTGASQLLFGAHFEITGVAVRRHSK